MKNILLTILAFTFATAVYAQEETPAKPKIGINAGATATWLRGNDYVKDNDPAVNFLIGVSFELPLTERLSFATSLNYERRSMSRTITLNDNELFLPDPNDPSFNYGDVTFRFTDNYLAIPLNLRYHIGTRKNFYINAGPYAAIHLTESTRVNGNKVDDAPESNNKTLEIGVNLGVGTKIRLTNTQNLNIELRDNLGLTNIAKVNPPEGGPIKSNTLNLIVNWEFSL